MARVGLDVRGPWLRGGGEGFGLVGEEGASGVLKAGEIACHGGEEAVDRFLRGAVFVLRGERAAGRFDKFAKSDGGPAGLGVQPSPVTGEEGDFARDHAGTGARGWGRRSRPEAAYLDGRNGLGFAEIEVDLMARDSIEDEDGLGGWGSPKEMRYD